jgi:ubiquinone/menaquinone biosynthesis C-methylase UbiE
MNLSLIEFVNNFGLMPGQVVADFGCGAGELTQVIADVVGKSGQVIAIDIREEPLIRLYKLSKEKGLNIDTILIDLDNPEATHLIEGAVNAVHMSHTLTHLENADNVLKEAHRILKNNGLLILNESESHICEDKLKSMVEKNGFRYFTRFKSLGEKHYCLIFKK